MVGEVLIEVLFPRNESNWPLIITSKGIYEMRTGGYKKILDFSNKDYAPIECEKHGLLVTRLWTDEESVFTQLEDNSFIITGFLDINYKGEMTHSVFIKEYNQVEGANENFENAEWMRLLE